MTTRPHPNGAREHGRSAGLSFSVLAPPLAGAAMELFRSSICARACSGGDAVWGPPPPAGVQALVGAAGLAAFSSISFAAGIVVQTLPAVMVGVVGVCVFPR